MKSQTGAWKEDGINYSQGKLQLEKFELGSAIHRAWLVSVCCLFILIGCIQPPPETLLCRSTSFKWVKWNPSKPLSDIVISCCCPKELQDSQQVSCGVMGKVSSAEFCCLVYCLNSTVQQHLHFTEKKKWGQVHHPIIIATIFWVPTMCYYVLPEDAIITTITLF